MTVTEFVMTGTLLLNLQALWLHMMWRNAKMVGLNSSAIIQTKMETIKWSRLIPKEITNKAPTRMCGKIKDGFPCTMIQEIKYSRCSSDNLGTLGSTSVNFALNRSRHHQRKERNKKWKVIRNIASFSYYCLSCPFHLIMNFCRICSQEIPLKPTS